MTIKYTAKTLSEYVRVVIAINREECGNAWFRGHASASYRLTPSVLRDVEPLADARGNPIADNVPLRSDGYTVTGPNPERMLDEFKRKALPYLNFHPRNDFEWLFLMQHHGVPTRLLDWTTNALVALYFAVESLSPSTHKSSRNAASRFLEDDDFRSDGAAVFSINPNTINGELCDLKYPVDVCADVERWIPYTTPTCPSTINTHFPICILAPHISPRIRAQSGTFTLHGSNIWSLDYYTALGPHIRKIFIPYAAVETIKNELMSVGITTSFVYPDLDGLSREIKIGETFRYSIERAGRLSKPKR